MHDLPAFSPIPCCETPSPYREALDLVETGQYEAALAYLDWAIHLDAENYQAWTLRGLVLVCLGRYEEALQSCDAALALRPYYTEAWQFRGIALHGLNRYREAYASYNRALGQPQEAIAPPFVRWLRNWLMPATDPYGPTLLR
ncbi:MAG: tetratricopeptide repeat protein [Elainellaceae cyanobacterium]